jgi:hypothetical protein
MPIDIFFGIEKRKKLIGLFFRSQIRSFPTADTGWGRALKQ